MTAPEPLRKFRNWLVSIRQDPDFRDTKRRNGTVYTKFRKAFLQICGLDTFDLIEEQLQYNTRTQKGDSQNLIQEEYATARMKLAEAKESHIASLQKIQETQAEIDALQDQITILDADIDKPYSENMRVYLKRCLPWRRKLLYRMKISSPHWLKHI